MSAGPHDGAGRAEGDGERDRDIDARFAEIVANLRGESRPEGQSPAAAEGPAGGAAEQLPPDPGVTGRHTPAERDREQDDGPDAAPGAWRGWGEDGEEHFVPPEPPPLPAGDLHFWGIFVGLVGGPLVLVLAHVFGVLHGPVWNWIGLGLALAGFVLLVLRLPTHRDDDPSAGARV